MSKPIVSHLKVLDLVPFGQEPTNGRSFFALRLESPKWESWRPGQFVMLRPQSFGLDIPWARPFGICQMTDRHMVCFFQVVGKGTECMAKLRPDDIVNVWGPLGNSFAMEPDTPTLLLAGGIGIVPFVGYVQAHTKPWNVTMLFGHKGDKSCYPLDNINERIAVDTLREYEPADIEKFVHAMHEGMTDMAKQNGLVLACGPQPFLKTVQKLAAELTVRTQLSLESRMACGVGACLGCVATTTEAWPVQGKKNWPVQVCNHGPIFWSEHIILD